MSELNRRIATLIIITFSAFTISCEDTKPQTDFKTILTNGKWLITQNTISPGVRFGNTQSSPIITDVKSATLCRDNKFSGAFFFFESDGKLASEITCNNSADFGKKISDGNRWELSIDQKTLNIIEKISNTTYEIISFDSNSFKMKGKVNYRDAFTNQNVLQENNITFTKF